MACIKRKFWNKKDAKKFLRVENMKFRNEEPLTSVYRCLDCGYWHVTHKDKLDARDKKMNGKMKPSEPSAELIALRNHFKRN